MSFRSLTALFLAVAFAPTVVSAESDPVTTTKAYTVTARTSSPEPPEQSAPASEADRSASTEKRLYRVGARTDGSFRYTHPYGAAPQTLPVLPVAGLTGSAFGF